MIRNRVNGKRYVGSASDIANRFRRHKSDLNRKIHKNIKLQNAWNKYGAESFEFIVIEYLEKNRDVLVAREQHWIYYFDVVRLGYNISSIASSQLGYRHTEETKKIISEHSRNMAAESRKKAADSRRGLKITPEQSLQRSLRRRGIKKSEKTLRALHSSYKKRVFRTNIKDMCSVGKKKKPYTRGLYHQRLSEIIIAR